MYFNRDFYLKKLADRQLNGRIKLITGIRRCGKSVLLFDIFMNHLKQNGVQDNQIIALKLDVAANAQFRNPLELDKHLRGCITDASKQYYVLLDEIQEVRPIVNPWLNDKNETIGFVDVLLGLLELKNVDIYVTGSNSKMLSSDILTEFKDRGDEIHVNPLSFKEFYSVFAGDKRQAWQEYATFGGLPHILEEKTDEDKSRYLQNLIKKTYLTDVIERNNLKKDISVLDDLLNIVASNVGSLTNPTKLESTFASVKQKKVSDSTISSYIAFFGDAFLLHTASQYNIKGRKYIGSPMKYYFSDIGLRNAQLNFRQQDEGHIMENVLYNELNLRGFNVDVGVVEINTKDEEGRSKRIRYEVDFVVNMGDKRCYIQSAFAIPDEDKLKQETNSLRRIKDSFKKIVVKGNHFKPWTDDDGILYIGIEDFLLNYIDKLKELL